MLFGEGDGRRDDLRGIQLDAEPIQIAANAGADESGVLADSAGEGGAAQPDTKSQLQQGYLEKSNVSSVAEMSRMIQVTRTYTQISTLLQQESDLHKSAIEKLADVPA